MEQESKNEASEDAHEKKLQRLGSATPQKCPEDLDLDELGREIGAENYQVISLLGVGSQGRVYLVRLTSTDQYFALKVFRKDKILPNEKTTRSILTEHRFLATTDHPFVTKLYHSFHSYERLFMVMEFCPGGELFTTIKKQPNGHLSEEQVLFYASEVVLVLEFIHSKGYIYRDLKPENILLHLDGHIRMADFGLSKQSESGPNNVIQERSAKGWNPFGKKKRQIHVGHGEVLRTSSLVGSVHYLAPEVVSGDSYDVMADWWAFGVLLYDMFYGFPPFKGRTNKEIIGRISLCDYSFPSDRQIGPHLKHLIRGLLKLDPRKRICSKYGANDIKQHPFFEGTHWGLLRNRSPPIIPEVKSPCDTSHFEIYAGDEDSVDFNFFSELPEDSCSISKEEQSKFAHFSFTRDSFGAILADRKNKLDSKNRSNSAKNVLAKVESTSSLGQDSPSKEDRLNKTRAKTDGDSGKRKKKKRGNTDIPSGESSSLENSKKDEEPVPDTLYVAPTKKAKKKPVRKVSATHKEDDSIVQE